MSDIAPITLHTDASDYGVGGYLFQTVDGIDQPVAFVSKSLNKSQLRMDVCPLNRLTTTVVDYKDEDEREEVIYVCNRLWLSRDLQHVDNLVVSDQLVFPNKLYTWYKI